MHESISNAIGSKVRYLSAKLDRGWYYALSLPYLGVSTIKFFIFAQGRTGSTLLASLLDSHPSIECEGEILGAHHGRMMFPHRYAVGRMNAHSAKAYGFHVKVYQLTNGHDVKNPSSWVHRMQRNGWKIIFLKRENLARHAFSNIKAAKKDIWHTKTDTHSPSTVKIDPKDMESRMENRKAFKAEEKNALKGADYFEVVYEDNLLGEKNQKKHAKKFSNTWVLVLTK